MASKLSLTIADESKEKSNAAFDFATLTAGNFAATVAAMGGFVTALDAITIGTIQEQKIVASEETITGDYPTVPFAQRESKWTIHYHDATTGRPAVRSVPCADLSLKVAGTDLMDITTALSPGLLFVAAFEGNVLGPDGNASIVDFIEFTGHNL